MNPVDEITSLIPHRPPFLWVDKIVSFAKETIVTEKTIPHELDVFTGHYPGNPLMPGVLLCEAIFQTGALLMAKMGQQHNFDPQAVPVLTRINNAKFKRNVRPGDTVEIKVRQTEVISSASFFRGTMKVAGKVAVQVDFGCTMVISET